MQLTSIRLSGFKSFVDATHIRVNGQCIGVVGPNGCGKSNIIDAVRWVLGESRAGELRGESMRDVIFSGSLTRKPAGRASVELVFDNSDGRIPGQWGQYGELAVRRVLTREGGSTYYINNTVVRRRDVQDIFMGTGLGPRAYAIIGQGMISRIIEARPEELRTFLEEAAGVSKYRERRKETESRLRETRDNLTRVGDILNELDQSMSRLEQQARQANHYRECMAKREHFRQTLWLIKYHQATNECERTARLIDKANTDLQAMQTQLTHTQTELVSVRDQYEVKADQVRLLQGKLYETNAKIGTVQADIRYIEKTRGELEGQLRQHQLQQQHWDSQALTLDEQIKDVDEQKKSLQQQSKQANSLIQELKQSLPTYELKYAKQQQIVSEQHDELAGLREKMAVVKTTVTNEQNAISELSERIKRLKKQREQLESTQLEDMASFDKKQQDLSVQFSNGAKALLAVKQRAVVAQQSLSNVNSQLSQLNRLQLQDRTRMATLKELEPNKKAHTHAAIHYVRDQALWQNLSADDQWATALEVVLGEKMHARQIDNFHALVANIQAFSNQKQCLFATQTSQTEQLLTPPIEQLIALTHYVQCRYEPWQAFFRDCLQLVYTAPNMQTALDVRHLLPDGGVIVLSDGHIIDRMSVRLYAPGKTEDGFFKRRQQYNHLKDHLIEIEKQIEPLQQQQKQLAQQLTQLRIETDTQQRKNSELTHQQHQLQILKTQAEEKNRQYQLDSSRINSESADISKQHDAHSNNLQQQIKIYELMQEQLEQKARTENEYRVLQQQAKEQLHEWRGRIDAQRTQAQQLMSQLQQMTERYAGLNSRIQTAREQSQQASVFLTQGRLKLQTLNEEPLIEQRDELLALREDEQRQVNEQTEQLDSLTEAIKKETTLQLKIEQQLAPQREKIVSLQLKQQAGNIAVEQLIEQLKQSGFDTNSLNQSSDIKDSVESCQSAIDKLSEQIQAMGDVNLAASSELDQAQQRQQYLTHQSNDLLQAIDTLEGAIKRIDRQTRALLKDTFEQVNLSLAQLFPMLFGGGQARLEMTGEEILDAGLQILAQPPGKKNATIHLLSGGEKALTAISLVFSLFKLNPAPFCLLDEVDAPLDDANTERFCNMVKKMSDNTQFLFISHNRIAMEMAGELVGVTMQERGVSRIVAVDIDEAAGFLTQRGQV